MPLIVKLMTLFLVSDLRKLVTISINSTNDENDLIESRVVRVPDAVVRSGAG